MMLCPVVQLQKVTHWPSSTSTEIGMYYNASIQLLYKNTLGPHASAQQAAPMPAAVNSSLSTSERQQQLEDARPWLCWGRSTIYIFCHSGHKHHCEQFVVTGSQIQYGKSAYMSSGSSRSHKTTACTAYSWGFSTAVLAGYDQLTPACAHIMQPSM